MDIQPWETNPTRNDEATSAVETPVSTLPPGHKYYGVMCWEGTLDSLWGVEDVGDMGEAA